MGQSMLNIHPSKKDYLLKTAKEMQQTSISQIVIIYDLSINSYFIESRSYKLVQMGVKGVCPTVFDKVRPHHILKRHGEICVFRDFLLALKSAKKIDEYVTIEIEEGTLYAS